MLTDTHCHLDFDKFDDDREAVIQRAIEAGVTRILIPGLDWDSSLSAVKLARSHPNLFAAVGFHPTDIEKWNESSIENLRNLAKHLHSPVLPGTARDLLTKSGRCAPGASVRQAVSPRRGRAPNGVQGPTDKIVAIGEIGLDYYWIKEPEKRGLQHKVLKQQLMLAQEVSRPVIIHMREENDAWFGQASVDLLEILSQWHEELLAKNHPLAEKPGVLHSYNGNLETARRAINLNFYIGVTGPVTYKNANEKRKIIAQLPLEKLLIETDAPFLTPVPHRGQRNEPAFVKVIADKIAEIHMTTLEQVADITTGNAGRLFGWGG